jgi:hypothetical protein
VSFGKTLRSTTDAEEALTVTAGATTFGGTVGTTISDWRA